MSFRGPMIIGLCARFAGCSLLALTAMVQACGSDPVSPSQLSGLYRLTLVEGHAPPELVEPPAPATCT